MVQGCIGLILLEQIASRNNHVTAKYHCQWLYYIPLLLCTRLPNVKNSLVEHRQDDRMGCFQKAALGTKARLTRRIDEQPAILAAHLHIFALYAFLSQLCLVPVDPPGYGGTESILPIDSEQLCLVAGWIPASQPARYLLYHFH